MSFDGNGPALPGKSVAQNPLLVANGFG
jgi:hypothetical protein